MRFSLRTHESILLLAGIVGLIEQETARILFDLEPSSILSGGFVSLALGSIGLAGVRNLLGRKNGNDEQNGGGPS